MDSVCARTYSRAEQTGEHRGEIQSLAMGEHGSAGKHGTRQRTQKCAREGITGSRARGEALEESIGMAPEAGRGRSDEKGRGMWRRGRRSGVMWRRGVLRSDGSKTRRGEYMGM